MKNQFDSLSKSALKVQQAVVAHGIPCLVTEMKDTTRTAEDAAKAVGCSVGQIVKSLVFMGKVSGTPFLVVASGANRVDLHRLADLAAEKVKMAPPDFVREKTGFAIGGVPPLGHTEQMDVFIDEDLLEHEKIWAAAGTPNALFELSPKDLRLLTKGKVATIRQTA